MIWLRERFWYNGGKATLLLVAGLLFACVLTLAGIVTGHENDARPLEPLDLIGDYVLPQPVLESKVKVGGTVHVGPVVKCNLTEDEELPVLGELHFRRVGDGGTVVPGFQGSGVLLPGCWGDSDANPLRFFENTLPPEVTPGIWMVEGSDRVLEIAQENGEDASSPPVRDMQIWFSDQFEVVP